MDFIRLTVVGSHSFLAAAVSIELREVRLNEPSISKNQRAIFLFEIALSAIFTTQLTPAFEIVDVKS